MTASGCYTHLLRCQFPLFLLLQSLSMHLKNCHICHRCHRHNNVDCRSSAFFWLSSIISSAHSKLSNLWIFSIAPRGFLPMHRLSYSRWTVKIEVLVIASPYRFCRFVLVASFMFSPVVSIINWNLEITKTKGRGKNTRFYSFATRNCSSLST